MRAAVFIAILFFAGFSLSAQTKQIRLRNEIITTSPAAKISVQSKLAAQNAASGLYLIQFENHPQAAERARLAALGVKLIQYVPDDAFIARFKNVSPQTVQALSFVRYVGAYQADYKIHPRLSVVANSALQKNVGATTNISVLISPDATATEIAAVKSLFVSIQHESRLHLGTILRGEVKLANLSALANADSVLWIESAPKRKLVDEAASKIVGGDDGNVATPTVTEQMGFDGRGVTVCVADTGLDTGDTNTLHPDVRGRVTGFKFYGNNITDGSDGYGHGTHCAGIIAGNAATGETDPDTGQFYGLGVASGSSLFIERIFDDAANEANPFPSDETLAQDAVRAGAQIGANSWGNDVQGAYDLDAAAFDELVRDADSSTPGDQPYVLEFSAGNAGPAYATMDSPASGKNVIATGASENVPGTLAETYGLYADGADTMADFSSRGPTEDGRIKPDLVAPGTWIASMASVYADESAVAWSVIDDYYVYMGGTSMAGPHAAGAAAVFMQYYESLHTNAIPSPALVKAALINSAEELDVTDGGPGPAPNNDEGWGRITLTNIIVTNLDSAPRFYQYLDQTVLLTSGQTYEQHALVRTSGQPLKITLAYTDVPGFPGAIPALVNDLNLEVVAPDGTLYRGNQFSGDESVPNAPSPDTLNNVEGVYLSHPMPGDYLVRVRASNVAEDARLDTAAIDQDFALVVSGDLARPNGGLILLDRTNYTAPATIQLEVFDAQRAASNAVSVLLKSSTEPAGEMIALNAAGNYGVFTGAVQTVVGAAAVDGKLEVANGDAIEADYTDSSGVLRTAHATADLIPPVLSGVAVTTDLGVITITWQTSEPADSVVRYGTNSADLNLAVTNSALVTSHVVKIGGLIPGKTYYFEVSSSDAAGNSVTDNNSGAFFNFVAVATPTVLMVDDYDTAAEENSDSTVIPDGVYTNAIAAAGFNYSFWKVTERGSPTLADLQPFQVVIWRTTDDVAYGMDDDDDLGFGLGETDPSATNNTLSAAQQLMIQNYLNGGGAFFMSSMSILSQLAGTQFARNVLQVGGFKQNPDGFSCPDCDEDFGVPTFFGAPDNPISGDMYVTLDYDNYPSFNLGLGDDDGDYGFNYGPDFSDTFTPATNATAICFESVSGRACGASFPKVGVDSPGRVVFLSFPIDTVPFDGTPPDNEVILMRNILNFLAPGANGVGSLFLDKSTYTAPDQVIVEMGDSDLIGAGHAQVTFSASSSANPVTVTLSETTHRGLFRGFLTLVPGGAATNQLAVANGDTITATYFDASRGSNVVATATVDTVPPVISNVAASTNVSSATVTWTTSTPEASLVQYGASTISSRTASHAQFATTHSVSLSGLQANRTYHFQVTSRDAAGNATVDDNHGALYTFTTLPAPQLPWFDDLESGAPGWTVVSDSSFGQDLTWTLGTPNNGLVSSAHSGVNAWGSDLNGQPISFLTDTYLISPAIDLSGLSQATLTFWDCFDFSQAPVEEGQILVSVGGNTNFSTMPVLADFSDLASDDWELETLDLTPYVGQTVQIVWEYAGYFSAPQYYGWTIDDIGITGVTSSGSGTIVISKNLGQGAFNLTGPLNRSGSAISTTLTNAPPGDYTVTFSDVAFYQTPASQTNTLTANGTINFTGNYTFTDTNHNGISDAWENYYFGSAGTNRTQTTDSDGDGMNDYAEFIAGTNPTNAASKLIFVSATVQTNQAIQLKWSAVPGRIYQLESSTNLVDWTPVTDWQQAVTSPVTYTGTNAVSGAQFFRVEVRP